MELTLPFKTLNSLYTAKQRKLDKVHYQMLRNDLEAQGWRTKFVTIEISAIGHYLPTTASCIKNVFHLASNKLHANYLTVLLRLLFPSHTFILLARKKLIWNDNRPLNQWHLFLLSLPLPNPLVNIINCLLEPCCSRVFLSFHLILCCYRLNF